VSVRLPKRRTGRLGALKIAGCVGAFLAVSVAAAALTPQVGAQAEKPARAPAEKKREKPKKERPPDPDAPTPEAQLVGASFCSAPACHGAMLKDFSSLRHSHYVSNPKLGDAAGCETCHGPASDHLGDPEHRKIFRFSIQTRENARRINETCIKCHQETVRKPHYESLSHTREGVSCATCHEVHYDLGTPYLLRLPGKDGPAGRPLEERKLKQLLAHARTERQIDGGTEGQPPPVVPPAAGAPAAPAPPAENRPTLEILAKTRVPIAAWRSSFTRDPHVVTKDQAVNEICGSCHRRELSEARGLSHHPLLEGRMGCTACHDPHRSEGGRLTTGRMLSRSSVSETCLQCHQQLRGPFRFEHEPVKSGGIGESCMECHRPHGSPNRGMLVMPTRAVCLQCHVDIQRDPPHQSRTGSCWRANCHTAVHGSNHSREFFFE